MENLQYGRSKNQTRLFPAKASLDEIPDLDRGCFLRFFFLFFLFYFYDVLYISRLCFFFAFFCFVFCLLSNLAAFGTRSDRGADVLEARGTRGCRGFSGSPEILR